MFDLKPLTRDAIPRALEKAERYRLLNEPGEAESICEDVLSIEPENQQAFVTLLLALTDQFGDGVAGHLAAARDALGRLQSAYDRAYYAGIVSERHAKARLKAGAPGATATAREHLYEAMARYEEAEALRPPGNDDALLRWNACARLLMRNGAHVRRVEERFEPFLE